MTEAQKKAMEKKYDKYLDSQSRCGSTWDNPKKAKEILSKINKGKGNGKKK